MDDVRAEAEKWGVKAGYHDVFGQWHAASAEALRAVVASVSRGRDAPAGLEALGAARRAFQGDGRKCWGLALQLYAVKSSRNWGIGDFEDLRAVIDIAAQSGASLVGLNPLHALFLDRPDQASPYSPNSRLFLNPLYIAVDQLAGVSAQWNDAAQTLRDGDLVDYAAVARLKIAALKEAYSHFKSTPPPAAFTDFQRERGEPLTCFSCFEVLRAQHHGRPWWEWPEPWRSADRDALSRFRAQHSDACEFVEFMQWAADDQLGRCRLAAREKGLGVGLYLDLAVGVDPAGADTWANQSAVMADLSIGAPPDEFNPAGQNWGLAPFNPYAMADRDFAAFRAVLSAAMRYAGAVRLDHVLGLMRLYVIPRDGSARDGAYVTYPFEHLLRVVAEESRKHRCVSIGEDLGTVPDGFRETAAKWGVWTYRVVIFERRPDGSFTPPSHYPAEALVTFTTHDLPSFAGWMSGDDLRVKRAIGVDPGESDDDRRRARRALHEALSSCRGPNAGDNFASAAGFIAATPSRLAVAAIDDLLGVVEQTNIPGTIGQHPNWRRKLPLPVESWSGHPTFKAVCAAFDHAGRSERRR